ncbi:MAG: EamA family transporter [bacterium]|nr:EamA family transporter [bacterium]
MIGYFEVLGAVAIWAFFNGVLVKGIKTSGVGVGIWTALVGIIIFILTLNYQHLSSLNRSQFIGLVALGIFAALNNACFYTALKISIPNAALFHYLAPMLVIVWSLSVPIFYEPVALMDVLSLVISFAGIVYVAIPNLKEKNLKLIYLGSLSAIFYSLEIVLSGYVSQDLAVAPEISAFFKLILQAGVMLVLAIILSESIAVQNNKEWLKIAGGGVLLYLSFILYFSGSATVSDLHRGILSYIDRIGAIALGVYFFKEKITKNIVIGGLLILGAGLLLLI